MAMMMAGNGCSEYRCLRIQECPSDSHIHNVSLRQANGEQQAFTYSCIIQSDCGPCSHSDAFASEKSDRRLHHHHSLSTRRGSRAYLSPHTLSIASLCIRAAGAVVTVSAEAVADKSPGRWKKRGKTIQQRSSLSILFPLCSPKRGKPEPHLQNHSIMDEMALISRSTTQLTETNVHSNNIVFLTHSLFLSPYSYVPNSSSVPADT